MEQKRIVIFSALYMPHLGGVEKYSQSIAAELSKDSQVTVFCMNTEKQPFHIKEGAVDVYFLPCFPLLKGRFPVPHLSTVRFLQQWFKNNQVDFGIVQCRFYLLSLIGCRFFAAENIPFIQIEHGAGKVFMPDPLTEKLWNLYDNTLNYFEKKIPHDYYTVSKAGLKWLEHYGIKGVGVISNSIDPKDFEQALAKPGVWKKQHHISDDTLMITFTGRLMEEKGVLDLLRAYDQLQGENLFLIIAGDGNMNLVKPWLGRKDILFTGQIPFQEIPALLADTDIFCLPSHFVEGKPTGVLEAGYCRNAVVASNSGGTTEIIPDERFGKLVPAEDIPALTQALQELVDEPESRKSMGNNLHDRICELFTWKTAAEDVRKAMKRCGL